MESLKRFTLILIIALLFLSLSLFGIVVMANQTALNPDFVVAQLDKLDLSLLTSQLLKSQIPQQVEFTGEFLSDIVADMEPEIKTQASGLVYSAYDYFTSRSQELKLTISLITVKEKLRTKIFENQEQIIPSYLATASQSTIEQYLDEIYKNATKDVPDRLEYTQGSWGKDVKQTLENISLTVGYFILGYRVLIGLILFLILGLFIFVRPVRAAVRVLGIIFLCAGFVQLALYFGAVGITRYELTQISLPLALQSWLPPLIDDFLRSLAIVSIVIFIIGIILVIVARKPKQRKRAKTESVTNAEPVFTCFNCGARYIPGDKFCKICGTKIQHFCPHCGASVELTEQFCTHCGNKLVES